ncbi:MAG: universal stress protein [Candidatus Acidiferrales bacterium]
MTTLEAGTRISLKNILFLTDFSEPSEAALPFAIGIARAYGAKTFALHVLRPDPLLYTTPASVAVAQEAQEETAKAEMQRIEAHLADVPHETMMEWGIGVWPTIERAIKDKNIDFLVVGTHGRTGAQRLLLGSIAEEIFRRSTVPVLTIGPAVPSGVHNGARFHRVLFATDFSAHSLVAWPYALSLAQENQARLLLLHVIPKERASYEQKLGEISVASPQYRLNALLPKEADFWCRPEAVVEEGDPATRIVTAAKERGADLIVLGVRNATKHLGAATHLERVTAHRVVANAKCPVLTVRG